MPTTACRAASQRQLYVMLASVDRNRRVASVSAAVEYARERLTPPRLSAPLFMELFARRCTIRRYSGVARPAVLLVTERVLLRHRRLPYVTPSTVHRHEAFGWRLLSTVEFFGDTLSSMPNYA